MTSTLFLATTGMGFAAALGYAFHETAKTKKMLGSLTNTAKTKFPKAAEKLMFFAQISEIAHLVQHATAVNMLVTFVLFGLWVVAISGAEGEIY